MPTQPTIDLATAINLAQLLNTTYDTLIKEYHDHMNPKPKPRTFRNLWGLLSEDH